MQTKECKRVDSDTPWKDGIENLFQPCVEMFFPALAKDIDWGAAPKALDKELLKLAREEKGKKQIADKLMEVKMLSGTYLYVHLEIQAQKDKQFEERMYWYNNRLQWRLGKRVLSVAVLVDEHANWKPYEYETGEYGWGVQMQFMKVKVLEYQEHKEMLWRSNNPFSKVVLSYVTAMETKGAEDLRARVKARLLKDLERREWSDATKRHVFNFMDWVLELRGEVKVKFDKAFEQERKMYLNRFERAAMDEGMQQGMQQGREEGEHDGQARMLGHLLECRFNAALSDAHKAKLKTGSLDDLERWANCVMVASSIEEVFAK